jgi:hypothetical protein
MRKVILITLIFIAIPLYAWNIFQLVQGYFSGSRQTDQKNMASVLSVDDYRLAALAVEFEGKGKSPFDAYKKAPAPVKRRASIRKKTIKKAPKPKEPEEPPPITITGIMWNPSMPVAMVRLPDGSSAVAKPGQQFGEITVKKIEQNRIQVSFQGKDFWINR